MGTFKNSMDVASIEFAKNVHCLCPLGGAWCTYQVSVDMYPADLIPDYMDLEDFFHEKVDGNEYTIEDAASKIVNHINIKYRPATVTVKIKCTDAAHFPVVVTVVKTNI